jgi:two-component system cell cycle response regulator
MGGAVVSVLLADIDHFKKVNDIHGHSAGDEVLREFGRRLRENIRPIDLACRYGGEEFVVIMPETSKALAQAAGERIRNLIGDTPFTINRGDQLKVTMSGGVATAIPPDDTLDAMMKRADEALYRAKTNGRNLIEIEHVGLG